ncbi:MAG: PEP-utilizing enzyme, partial [Patescibacteria group bacterium]
MSFWHQCLSDKGHSKNLKDFGIKANLDALSIIFNGHEANIFKSNPNYTNFCSAVLEAVNSKEKINSLKNKYIKYAKSLENTLIACLKNLDVYHLGKFFKEYQRFCAGLMITATMGRSGSELLVKKLQEKSFRKQALDDIIATITFPDKQTPLLKSQLDMLEIAKQVKLKKLNPALKLMLLKKWLLLYQHIPVNFCGDPWTILEAKKQLNSVLEKNISVEIKKLKENNRKKIIARDKKLKEINDKEISVLSMALAEGTYLNEFRKNIFSKISLMVRPIFKKIAHMGGAVNWRDCYFLIPGEMISLLQQKNIAISKIKKKRKIVIIVRDNKGTKIIEGKKAKFFEKKVKLILGIKKEKIESKPSIVKGFSANKGKVSGIVKIILTSKDFKKLKNNEILVTTMTSVDFIPIMEKAAAFITNEGGITSHAAIVAREMNKPCIIGTKIATRVLKDGDLVEVDANNGVVKIIKE